MKNKRVSWIFAACAGMFLLAGCGGENQEIFRQAEKDMEQGSYEYARQGFETSVSNGWKMAESYRGAGICSMRLGNYEDAIAYFTNALNCEKVSKSLAKDVLSYRAAASLQAGLLDDAMADCQTLSEEYTMDAETYFLTGEVALTMDSYDEAASNFQKSYEEDTTYDRAIEIYESYLEQDMEADGTKYLEAALETEPKDAEDYCDRGRVYYYMEDYEQARKELIEASNQGDTEALLYLGMVYQAQKDISNARSMYQDYISKGDSPAKGYNGLALCDIAEGNYGDALTEISNGLPLSTTEEMQDLLYNEIVIYEKQLDFSTALQKAKEYLEIFPEDGNMEREMKFLQSRVGTTQ
ncbi:tetratricopeptide repeat protein [Blautia sp. HCP3S3_G3]|uniref:tetratricopeptide repeat protein n=1 Tax=Blautia sp. HCP3S3_G3 TaxID=3438913 RepID=UPI003F89CAF3